MKNTTENINKIQEENTMKNTKEFNRFMTGLMAIDAELAQTDYDDWSYRDIERRRKNYISRYAMNSSDEQTINWLREHGYMDEIDEDMYTARMEQESKWDGLDELIAYDEQRMAAQRAAEAEAERNEDAENESDRDNDDEEDNEMKEKFIEMIDRYYDESCYEAEELVVSESTREECRELVAYSEGPEDNRDKMAAEIHKKLIEYLQTLPEEHFEEILADYDIDCVGFDEMVDLIYNEYIAAPFDIDYDTDDEDEEQEPTLKKKFIEAAKYAPAKVFANGVNGMTEEQVRAKLIEHYRDYDEDDFEGDEQCMHQTNGEHEAICDALRIDAINWGLIDKNTVVAEFYKFFNEALDYGPMHLKVTYGKITDWRIIIYKWNCAEYYPDEQRDGTDAIIASIQFCDESVAFAMAHAALLRWMKKYHNYEE